MDGANTSGVRRRADRFGIRRAEVCEIISSNNNTEVHCENALSLPANALPFEAIYLSDEINLHRSIFHNEMLLVRSRTKVFVQRNALK